MHIYSTHECSHHIKYAIEINVKISRCYLNIADDNYAIDGILLILRDLQIDHWMIWYLKTKKFK